MNPTTKEAECELFAGPEAASLLNDGQFREDWGNLERNCPWATAYQAEGFVMTWYRTFRDEFEPVLAVRRHPTGGLQGLLTLAQSKGSGELVCAGGRRAEYQTWLATPELGNTFITEALTALAKAYPRGSLHFQYLPVGTPLEWARSPRWKHRCLVDQASRPVIAVGDGKEAEALRKKRYRKGKLDELQKLGEIEFRQVNGVGELEGVIDEIIDFYDFRQGATHYDMLPFRSDPNRRRFYLELAAIPGLLHATTMRVGGKLASACLSIRSRDEAVLDVIAHSPVLARYSVGMLHMFRLAASLVDENVRQLDLTPGGFFKERLATGYEQVHLLSVSFGIAGAAEQKSAQVVRGFSKRLLTRVGLLHALRKLLEIQVIPKSVAGFWRRQTLGVYFADLRSFHDTSTSLDVRKNELRHILDCLPGGGKQRRTFLKSALERLESGHYAYTMQSASNSISRVWVVGSPGRFALGPGSSVLDLPAGAVALYDIHCDSDQAKNVLLRAVICDLRRVAEIKGIYAITTPKNGRALERAGFVKLPSEWLLFGKGRTKSYTVPAAGSAC